MREKTKHLIFILLIPLLIVFSKSVDASWTLMNGDGFAPPDGYFDIWAYSDTDVFLSGCTGTRMHYDGNPQETWYEWPEIQGH